ncbi:MAG: acetyl-CoA carboxylase biotin carboxylase subunit family protein [Fimbriimonadaceae bacterium]
MPVEQKPRALVMHPIDWLGVARLPGLLAEAGFRVASLCDPNSLLAKTRHNERVFPIDSRDGNRALRSLSAAFVEWPCDLILPGDDGTVRLLQDALVLMREGRAQGAPRGLQEALARSLGDPSGFAALRSKMALGDLVRQLGLPIPERRRVLAVSDALAFAEEHGYPVLLKSERSVAGRGVRVCTDEASLAAAAFELLPQFAGRQEGTVFAERYVEGRLSVGQFVAWQGRVVGSSSAELTVTDPPGGPTTVMTCIENPGLEQMVRRIVERIGATGLGSVQAIVDGEGVPWFVEANPRFVPPMAPSRRAGFHVGRLLRSALEGTSPEPWSWPVGSAYALFPQEVLRDPESEWLEKAIHDVPEDDPPLLQAYWDYVRRERERRASR